MADTWTAEQVMALAPDPSSAKSGKELGAPRKWALLGRNDQAAWGLCQGSGKSPYQVSIDLSEPAFKCTCPSRKFPCKHSLGLFLILATQPAALAQGDVPKWVTEWLEAREARAEKKAAKAAEPAHASDPAAQQKRAAERQEKVVGGMQELDLWLRDLVRQGLAAVPQRPASTWETLAAHMVDAQAPGVSRLVRDMSGIPASGGAWPSRLLEAAARLHLLREAFSRVDSLPAAVQADVRTAIGWTQKQDALLGQPGVEDDWLVLGQRVEEEDRLRVQRSWLWGAGQGRPALVLGFAHASQPLDTTLVPGLSISAELVFFPGTFPLRALVKERRGQPGRLKAVPGFAGIPEAQAAYAAARSKNPWIEQFPVALDAVVPVSRQGQWYLRDGSGCLFPIAPAFGRGWQLASHSGGRAMAVFGEWNGEHLLPLSLWSDRFHAL